MEFTAPQRFLIESAKPGLEDYMIAIKRSPGKLELLLDKARQAGFGTNDLKALLGFALRERLIDMPTFKFHSGRLELAKTRKMRQTGKMERRDSALHDDDDDDPGSVTCVKCKNRTNINKAKLVPGLGWLCC